MPCCISVLMPEPLAPSLSPQGVSCPCPHGLAHAPRPQSPCISTWPPRPQIPCPQVQIARLGDPGSQGPWPRIPTPGQGGGAQDPGLQLPRTPGSQDLRSWILGCSESEGAGLGVDTYLRAWACNEIGIHTYFQIMACNEIGTHTYFQKVACVELGKKVEQ